MSVRSAQRGEDRTPITAPAGAPGEGDTPGLLTISGVVDERFRGFGDVGAASTVIMNVSGLTRMTSFGVRQWLVAMEALPKSVTELYIVGCPTVFVDQLNMMVNFGGPAKVLTVQAPYRCPSCDTESSELVDILAHRDTLARTAPEKTCASCGGPLEFDDTPESYFAFAGKYAPSAISASAAQLLGSHGLYHASRADETPVRIVKIVHGAVSYFRLVGTIGSTFRARPLLVGTEGEVVIDLAEVDRFEPEGLSEWKRLLKIMAQQVQSITLVDAPPSFFARAHDSLMLARTISIASLLVPYRCMGCSRRADVSHDLSQFSWPPSFGDQVCSTCGDTMRTNIAIDTLAPLQKASTRAPAASASVVANRAELLSRAQTDAAVARATSAEAGTGDDNKILGKYEIVRKISAGGMAEVFLAKQVGIGGFERPVAIKQISNKLLETRRQAVDLFLNEAKIAGHLTHPNIVQVLDVGEAKGALYLVMEFVHGRDLRDILKTLAKRKTVMPLAEACHFIREVAQALDFAHWSNDLSGKRLAVVHRDVSPHNVMIGFDGTVKLADFGVAMSSVTESDNMVVGKWMYMAPETATSGRADHRSDLFALGVVFYLVCSGVVPFSGANPKEIVKKVTSGQYQPLAELAPNVPPRICDLIARMLDPDPAKRPERGQEIVTELSEVIRETGLESSPQNVVAMMADLFPSNAPRITDSTGVRLATHDSSVSARSSPRRTSSVSIQGTGTGTGATGMARRKGMTESVHSTTTKRGRSTTRQPLPLARQQVTAPRTNGLVNLLFGLAIAAVVLVGAYMIVSRV